MRLNLVDTVTDLAPPAPQCFYNRATWIEYLQSAAKAQNHRDEQKIILIVDGQPVINQDFNFCEDCCWPESTKFKLRCNPNFLKEHYAAKGRD